MTSCVPELSHRCKAGGGCWQWGRRGEVKSKKGVDKRFGCGLGTLDLTLWHGLDANARVDDAAALPGSKRKNRVQVQLADLQPVYIGSSRIPSAFGSFYFSNYFSPGLAGTAS